MDKFEIIMLIIAIIMKKRALAVFRCGPSDKGSRLEGSLKRSCQLILSSSNKLMNV